MGITIHYRGTIDDLRQVETMEDRILDLALSLGGRAAIWRSFADHDCQRVVRGVTIEMGPGQETFTHRALAITQLKRALTGHAYARGAVFGLRSDETITGEQSSQFHDQLDTLLTTIHHLAEYAWI
ncbi:hypothetical protein Enr13x_48690 [Stieleria neptunia]|uniref:Uncharacterized protein n=1 Tax=Stieleria neptunia TaxID=2527979 RepID=A0A518HVW7_9BACT|nr:hypothetical protein [Stieleria neptunia]QDV44996.1 hypothetical protein Enr13x_48690 [Stieleria neptunia]